MLTVIVLGCSVIVQAAAAIMAIRLVTISNRRVAWGLISVALVAMMVHRAIPFYDALSGDSSVVLEPAIEITGLVVSVLMLLGVARIAPLFTAMRKTSHDLRETTQNFSTIIHTIPQAIYGLDNRGNVTLWNDGAERMFGWRAEEVQSRQVPIIPKEGLDEARAVWGRVLGGESITNVETVRLRKDGSRVLVACSTLPLRDSDDSTRGILTIVADLSERKQVEAEMIKLRKAVDSSGEVIFMTDRDGLFTFVNPAFTQLYGYGADEIVGKVTPRILKSGEMDNREYVAFWERILTKEHVRREMVNRAKDGRRLIIENSVNPVLNDVGTIIGFLAIQKDVTQQKRMEETLRESEERLLVAISAARMFTWEWDVRSDRLIRIGHDREANMQGLSFTQTSSFAYLEQVHPDDRAMVREAANRAIQGKTPFRVEYRVIQQNGEVRWLESQGQGSTESDGTLARMIGVTQDITDRKKVEERIQQTEEQFRLISENVADMIAVIDANGKRLYNSPSYKTVLGEPSVLNETDAFEEIHPDDRAHVKRAFHETLETGIAQRIEYRFLLKNGAVRQIESQSSVIKEKKGKISGVVMVSRDVTDQKNLELQFLRSQRMESIGTLASGIAHDLNNVLSPIMMGIDILRSKLSDHGARNLLDTMETATRRGSNIVKQVLAFGRGVKGERVTLQLKHVLNEVLRIVNETFPKQVDIRDDIPRNLWVVSANPTQIHQVLLNICVNARDAMPNGGTLTLAAENVTLDEGYARMHLDAKPGPYAKISIADTGTGIPPVIREKIFEPFFTTKEIGRGTGLGLSTSLAIVKSHGGFINVYSEVGQGSSFKIYLPADAKAQVESGELKGGELPTGKGELILVIDDEAAVREITKETLEAYGYRAIPARDGAEGVALFAEHKSEIKAIITDIMMPVMDGSTAIRVLQRMDPQVRIIAASGFTAHELSMNPAKEGIRAFLTKPYTADKLLTVLAESLK